MDPLIYGIIYALPLTALFTILIQIIIENRLARHRTHEERQFSKFNDAAEKFRTVIFTQFKGIYPFPRLSTEETNRIIRNPNSIIEIESAATEFSYFLSSHQRRKFIATLDSFREAYKTIDWQEGGYDNWYPSLKHLFTKDPKKVLFQHIESLLQFADEIK